MLNAAKCYNLCCLCSHKLRICIVNYCGDHYVCAFSIVNCSSLTDPDNGVISCSLADDNVTSYEDTCSFTCNTGHELIGSDTRTCQSDGSWSGSDDVCRRGTYKYFTNPMNYVCINYTCIPA